MAAAANLVNDQMQAVFSHSLMQIRNLPGLQILYCLNHPIISIVSDQIIIA